MNENICDYEAEFIPLLPASSINTPRKFNTTKVLEGVLDPGKQSLGHTNWLQSLGESKSLKTFLLASWGYYSQMYTGLAW